MYAEYTVWCTQSFLPLFPQLVIIISHILPTVPPGEPKTTKNKGKTCLKKSNTFHWCRSQSSLYGISYKCHGSVCVLPTWKKFRSLEEIVWKTNHTTPIESKWALPAEWCHSRASTVCVYPHQPVPPITPHTVESLRKLLSTFWWLQASQVWDMTVGRHRNKAVANALA